MHHASAMRAVTLGVTHLEQALTLFRDTMGLRVESDGELSDERRRLWGLEEGCRARLVELSCGGYATGRLRLLQLTPRAHLVARLDSQLGGPDSPLDIGPKAVDFYVRSPATDAWHEMIAAGCIARSPPVRHVIGDVESEECVLFGPDGVPLLIMVGHRHPPSQMRPGSPHGKYSEVPTVSVVAGDLLATRRFYGEGLGLAIGTDAETPAEFRDKVNELVGIPAGSRVHFLLYQQVDEPSGKILLVHFGDLSKRRLEGRMHPRHLGVALFHHEANDLDGLHTQLRAIGANILAAPQRVDAERVMLVRGPNEELFEFTERR